MKIFNIGKAVLVLAICALSACASVDRSGLSLNEGKELAEVKTKRICSTVAPVGSHMKKVICRTQEVIDHTSDRAQKALRDRSQRVALCPTPAMCSNGGGGNN